MSGGLGNMPGSGAGRVNGGATPPLLGLTLSLLAISFSGANSASFADLSAAVTEALSYLDRCLDAGFRPGMGNVVPDRLFWAQPEGEDAGELTAEEAHAPV